MINYVSNLPDNLRTGGFSSMNVTTYEALRSAFDVHYAGPVNPPYFYSEKLPSKVRRMTGLPGDFFMFSEKRLRVITREVQARCRQDAVLDFFQGFTPWVLIPPGRPYVASSDCTFHDYMEIFHRPELFTARDLSRIEAAEAAWLAGASMVLLRSRWAADRAVRHYGLDPSRVDTVKSCGEMDMPPRDEFRGGNGFVFVSTSFEAKGGHVVLSAFRQVRRRHVDAALHIIGDVPPRLAAERGVEAVGYLRKEVPADAARFRAILSQARALVHPTRGDVSPLIIVEAGYFGCPAISSRRFAIPELIEDGSSGVLLDDPADATAVAEAMQWMIASGGDYQRMRRRAWDWTRTEYSRQRFHARVVGFVEPMMPGRTPAAG